MNESTVPQVLDLFKQIMAEPERMFELVQMDMKEQCERVVKELLKTDDIRGSIPGYRGTIRSDRAVAIARSECL